MIPIKRKSKYRDQIEFSLKRNKMAHYTTRTEANNCATFGRKHYKNHTFTVRFDNDIFTVYIERKISK